MPWQTSGRRRWFDSDPQPFAPEGAEWSDDDGDPECLDPYGDGADWFGPEEGEQFSGVVGQVTEPAGMALTQGRAVEWTGDDGRIGHGQVMQAAAEGWALVADEDGQVQAVPAQALRPWAPGGQLRIL